MELAVLNIVVSIDAIPWILIDATPSVWIISNESTFNVLAASTRRLISFKMISIERLVCTTKNQLASNAKKAYYLSPACGTNGPYRCCYI